MQKVRLVLSEKGSVATCKILVTGPISLCKGFHVSMFFGSDAPIRTLTHEWAMPTPPQSPGGHFSACTPAHAHVFLTPLACRDRMQKRGFGYAARSPEAFQAQSSACCQYMHVAAGMHAGRGYFRAKSGAYTHGCEQGNKPNVTGMRQTNGPWRGEAKAKYIRFHFRENLVSIDTV